MTCAIALPFGTRSTLVAVDSSSVDGSWRGRASKLFRVEDTLIAGSGAVAEIQHVIRAWAKDNTRSLDTLAEVIRAQKCEELELLVVRPRRVICLIDESGGISLPLQSFEGVGSGRDTAIGYMGARLEQRRARITKAQAADLALACLRYVSKTCEGVSAPFSCDSV